MSFSILITLTTAGANTGPYFNLFGNNDGYAIPFETNVPKASLQAGYTSTVVPDGTTSIYVVSTGGTCNGSFVQMNISGLPSVTPTPSPQPTIYTLNLGYDASNGSTACSNYANFNRVTVYSYTPFASITNGTTIYKTYAVPLTDFADNGWYSDGTNRWINPGGGSLIGQTSCIDPTPTMTPTKSMIPVGYGVYTGATYGNSSAACAGGDYSGILNCYIGPGDTISNGDVLYTNEALSTTFNGNGQYYKIYKDSSTWAATISSLGVVSNLTSCVPVSPTATPTPTATPPPIAYYQVDILKGNAGNCSDTSSACYLINNGTTPDYTIYTVDGQLTDGNTAYTDALGTTPFAGGPGAGYYYSDGVSSVRINNSGYILVQQACGPGCV